jgi:hypothetical protein
MRLYGVLFSLFLLAGCASTLETAPSNIPVVPVSAVLNSLKCGLSEAVLLDRRSRSGLLGSTAKVELDANVIQGIDNSGNVSVGIPVAFAGLAGTITPSLGFTHSEVRTLNSSVDFDIILTASNPAVCRGVERGRDSGFSDWLGAVVASVNEAVAGPPYASMTQYVYESDFTVKTGGSGGLSVEIVPVKLTTSAGASRTDVHHMKITIDPVTLVRNKKGELVVKKKGPRFRPQVGVRRGHFNLPVR